MNRPLNKGRTRFRYGGRKRSDLSPALLRSVERFQTMGLRLAGFLHQFKTPLHVIQSQAELLLETPDLPSQARASLEIIHKNAIRLTDQTRSMMDLSRGRAETTAVAPLGQLIDDICHSADVDCRKNHIVLEKNLEGIFMVRMDAALEGALHNLVNNAIEAMPKGGTLRIRTFETPDRRRVGVEIRDSGMGMDAATRRRVQKTPFQSAKANGTGLGLYITKHILRRHKASMQVKSKPGEGTTVTVMFKKENTRQRALTRASVPSAQPSPTIGGRGQGRPEGEPRVRAHPGLWHKVLHAFAILAVLVAPLWATHTPTLLRVQGHFLDNQNVPLSDTLPVHFSIWDTEEGDGNLLWQDIQNVTIRDNSFQVVLGRGTPVPSSVFSGGDRWLEMQIGNDAPLTPRHRIPAQYLQAQLTDIAQVPDASGTPATELSPNEKRELELQIERYRDEATQAQQKLASEQAARDQLARQQALDAQAKLAAEQAAKEQAIKDQEAAEKAARAKEARKRRLAAEAAAAAESSDAGANGNVYTVKDGDTLKSIAQKLFGNAELWYDLYYLNRDRLGPMGHVFVGQILVLPNPTTETQR